MVLTNHASSACFFEGFAMEEGRRFRRPYFRFRHLTFQLLLRKRSLRPHVERTRARGHGRDLCEARGRHRYPLVEAFAALGASHVGAHRFGGPHVDGSRVHALHPTVCSSIATRWLWCGSCRHTHRLQRRVSWQFRADNGPGLPQRISDDCSTFRRGQKEFNVTGLDLRLAIRRTNACAHEVVETEIGVGYRLAV